MKTKQYLDDSVDLLELDSNVISLLKQNMIYKVNDLWLLKRKDLKNMGLLDSQINQITIKLQLLGMDLNKKIY